MKAYSTLLICSGALVMACGGNGTGTGGAGGTGSTTTKATSVGTGSTSTGMTGPTTTSTTTSTGSGPISCSGAQTNVPKGECDLLQQDCANGKTCVPVDNGTGGGAPLSTACLGDAGLKAPGSSCTTDTECQKGLFCFFDVCTPVCCPDVGSNSCNGGDCDLTITLPAPNTDKFFTVCTFSPQCTLFDPTTCAAGYGCQPKSAGLMTCAKLNMPTVPEGGTCNAANDCDTMSVCVGTPGVCRLMCDPATPQAAPKMGGCAANKTCQPTNLNPFGMTGLCM